MQKLFKKLSHAPLRDVPMDVMTEWYNLKKKIISRYPNASTHPSK